MRESKEERIEKNSLKKKKKITNFSLGLKEMDKLVHHFFLPIDVLQLDYLRAKRTNLVVFFFFFCQSHPVAVIVQFTQKVKYLLFFHIICF